MIGPAGSWLAQNHVSTSYINEPAVCENPERASYNSDTVLILLRMAEQQTSVEQQTTQGTGQTQQKKESEKADAKATHKTTQKPASASNSSSAAEKAKPVLTAAEVERMIDLGLGRGLDSTDPKPWYNKSAFQVRRVTAESVIGTEEGGSLQSYEYEVTSTSCHQMNLKAAVVVPQAPVQVGIDAEASRNVATTRQAVGKKVINRSISFRSDFDDASYGAPMVSPMVSDRKSSDCRSHTDSDSSVADTQSEYYTFEERISKWIIDRILYRQEREALKINDERREPKFKLNDAKGRTDPLSVLSHFIHISNEKERKLIIQDCSEFVAHFRITHYVSSIELGAAEYRVFSEREHTKRIGMGGTFGLEQVANLSVSESSTWKRTKKASDLRKIGKFASEGHVGRGTHDEAVVGIKIQPISSLVKLPFLNLALRRAIIGYMDQQGNSTCK